MNHRIISAVDVHKYHKLEPHLERYTYKFCICDTKYPLYYSAQI